MLGTFHVLLTGSFATGPVQYDLCDIAQVKVRSPSLGS